MHCITNNVPTKVPIPAYIRNKQALSADSSAIGLLSCLNLTATYTARSFKNGEGHIFVRKPGLSKSSKTNRGGKEGTREQNGLTNRAKRALRIVPAAYAKKFKGVRFITLSFRNIIPPPGETKRVLDNFLKRLRRLRPNAHYIWVAEMQKRGVVHFHVMTPENLVDPVGHESKEVFQKREREWLNKNWNEVVMNRLLAIEMISRAEHAEWITEYNEYAENYRKGIKGATKAGKYYLTPNLKHAVNPNVVGGYMSKYMSKSESKNGQKLTGNIWNISATSREFLKSTDTVLAPVGMHEDSGEVLEAVASEAKKNGVKAFIIDVYDGNKILWSNDIGAVIKVWKKQKSAIYSRAELAGFNKAVDLEKERKRKEVRIKPKQHDEELLTAEMWD